MNLSNRSYAPRLSICIPVYNFASFLPATIQSILAQDGADEVEIVVLDGASTDQTPHVMAQLGQRFPQIRYIRLSQRGGIDRDMAACVDQAAGDYCWLFSGDDIMAPGALRDILDQIDEGHDVYVCQHLECTITMEPLKIWPVLRLQVEKTFHLSDRRERKNYFELAQNSEAFFSFMSGIVVKKATWISVSFNEAFSESCWAHVARLFELIQAGLAVKYLPRALLSRRGGNDSFSSRGVVERYRIAIEGYNRLADFFFGSRSVEAFHIRRAIRGDLGLAAFIFAKFRCRQDPERESRALLDTLVRKVYCDATLSGMVAQLAYWACPTSRWLFEPMRAGNRLLQGRGL